MSLHMWDGPGSLRQVDLTRARPPEITAPTTPSPPIEGEQTRLYVCGAPDCGKRFKKPMIIARHFNSNHEDLRVDKDSWREYSEEVWE